MQNVIASLKGMGFKIILIILQLSIGLSMLNTTTSLEDVSQKKYNQFAQMFHFDRTYLIRMKDTGDKGYSTVNLAAEEIQNLKGNGVIENVYVNFSMPFMLKGLDELVLDKYNDMRPQEISSFMSKVLVNQAFIERNKLSLIEGRCFEPQDFDNNYQTGPIPIIVGSDYKDKISIGDIVSGNFYKNTSLSYDSVEIKFKVIGILEDNELPTILSKNKLGDGLNYSNSLSVIPVVNGIEDLEKGIPLGDFGLFIEIDNAKYDDMKNLMNTISSKYGLDLTILSLESDADSVLRSLNKSFYDSKYLGLALTLLSSIGIIAILLGNMQRRKKEFAIKICNGATLGKLINEVILENSIIVLTSSIISLFITILNNDMVALDIYLICKNIIFILLITLLISIPQVIKMKSLNITDLSNG